MKRLILGMMLLFASSVASASEKSTVQTSFNVPITKWSDDFAERYEYASPDVSFQVENGQLMQSASVSLIKKNGVTETPRILVMVAYGGDWQFYNAAIFKGGEPIEFQESNRNVLSCRYGCTYTESFFVVPTKAQLAKYGAGGNLTFQIRSKRATQAIITIPMAYFAAIQEAAAK
jgi:hypothetical protein